MNVNTRRFGEIEVEPSEVLHFPVGIAGFPDERAFILVRTRETGHIAWLQSARTPTLALPLVSAHAFGSAYPDVAFMPIAERAGLGSEIEDMAMMVVLSAPQGQPATVNLLAPIVVNTETRIGGQIFLEGTSFGTREFFVLPESSRQESSQASAPALSAAAG
jgi:flagellar assembly factor FliW